jgi:hypothetical protein
MAAFNPADYETVAERIKRFYADYPEGRIITKNQTTKQDRLASTWVVKASIFIPNWQFVDETKYLEQYVLKATGLAFEVDGQGMANKTSALENAETSAIGRALANAGYSGDKRASREEMEKVARANTPKRDWIAEADALALVYNLDGLRKLYSEAVANRVDAKIIEQVKQFGNDIARSQDSDSEPVRGQGTP